LPAFVLPGTLRLSRPTSFIEPDMFFGLLRDLQDIAIGPAGFFVKQHRRHQLSYTTMASMEQLNRSTSFSRQESAQNTRNTTIDLFRLFAIFGVIVVHTDVVAHDFFSGSVNHLVEQIFSRSGRLSVPFFFVVSGYFFGSKTRAGAEPLALFARYARRLLRIWVLWSLIYLLIPLRVPQWTRHGYWPSVVAQFEKMARHPLLIIWVGGKGHLWFLPALVMALAIAALCEHWRARGWFYVAAVLLYLLGLDVGLYGNTPFGFHAHFDSRNGPFMSTLLVACGYWLSGNRRLIAPSAALALAIVGWAGFQAELYWLPKLSGVWPPISDYGLFTPVFGVGTLLFALARPRLGGSFWPRIGARYVLGVYVCHLLFVEPAWPLHAYFHSYLWEFAFPLVVLGLALWMTALMARGRYSRYLVT
jgi:surface polysaccharide O-acyltransferase-like enzyme